MTANPEVIPARLPESTGSPAERAALLEAGSTHPGAEKARHLSSAVAVTRILQRGILLDGGVKLVWVLRHLGAGQLCNIREGGVSIHNNTRCFGSR